MGPPSGTDPVDIRRLTTERINSTSPHEFGRKWFPFRPGGVSRADFRPLPRFNPGGFPSAGMSEPLRRLIFFALGLLLWLAALEWLVRHNSALFEAASHRALTKVAIFQQHPRVEILFLGTSRTQDGVSPALVSRTIQGIAPELGPVPGFNAAFTAATLDLVAAQIPRFGFRPGLKVVVLELSAPELSPELLNLPVPWEQPKPAMKRSGFPSRLKSRTVADCALEVGALK